MSTESTFALIGPLLGLPWLLAYSVPVAAFALSGPWVLRRRGAPTLWTVAAVLAAAAGVVAAAAGGLHRRAMGTGGPSVSAVLLGTVVVGFLLVPPALVIRFLARRGATPGRQVLVALGVAVVTVGVASPLLFLWVGCVLSGECV